MAAGKSACVCVISFRYICSCISRHYFNNDGQTIHASDHCRQTLGSNQSMIIMISQPWRVDSRPGMRASPELWGRGATSGLKKAFSTEVHEMNEEIGNPRADGNLMLRLLAATIPQRRAPGGGCMPRLNGRCLSTCLGGLHARKYVSQLHRDVPALHLVLTASSCERDRPECDV